jgi:hypothetical protein
LATSTENLPTSGVAPQSTADRGGARAALDLIRRHPWVVVSIGIVIVATVLVLWANTSPGYDPYGWLVWGYQTLRLNLNLGGAPSWKPMPYLFTVPYSIFGHLSYWLWMITSVSIALGAGPVAGKIVYEVVEEKSDGPRWAAIVGAVFAGAGVLGIVNYFHYILSVQSDPMLVTFFLLAIDSHLNKRNRWAFTFLWLCSLGRPETWPFIGLYSIWAWREIPKMRKMIIGGLVLIPALWFGIPVLSGNSPFVAGQLAEGSPRKLHSNKIIGVTDRYRDLTYWPIHFAAGVGLIIAWFRRRWNVLLIGGCAALWFLVEVAFVLHGWPGVPRYMFEAGACEIVVAGIGIAWILQETARISQWARAGGIALVVALVAVLIPDAVQAMRVEHKDLRHERARTTAIHRLDATLKAVGGYQHVRYCGGPSADVEWVSILAWYTKLNIGKVGHRPHFEIYVQKKPAVLFTPLPSGWVVHTYHLLPSRQAACAALNGAKWVYTPAHPGGVLLHGG